MASRLGVGGEGWSNQLKMSLDQDAGRAHKRIELRLIHDVFRTGTRSDVQRLLLRHFVEHAPDIAWMRQRWRKPLGEGWPDAEERGSPMGHGTRAELASGGEV